MFSVTAPAAPSQSWPLPRPGNPVPAWEPRHAAGWFASSQDLSAGLEVQELDAESARSFWLWAEKGH